MVKYGVDSFIIDKIIICPLTELDDQEKAYIDAYGTQHPNGYNLRKGGNNGGKHHPLTIEKIGDSNRGLVVNKTGRENIGKASKYRNMSIENKDRLKKVLEDVGLSELPMYVVFSIDKRYNRNVEVIQVRNPDYPSKKFGKKNMLLADKIRLAISYTQRSSV